MVCSRSPRDRLIPGIIPDQAVSFLLFQLIVQQAGQKRNAIPISREIVVYNFGEI